MDPGVLGSFSLGLVQLLASILWSKMGALPSTVLSPGTGRSRKERGIFPWLNSKLCGWVLSLSLPSCWPESDHATPPSLNGDQEMWFGAVQLSVWLIFFFISRMETKRIYNVVGNYPFLPPGPLEDN